MKKNREIQKKIFSGLGIQLFFSVLIFLTILLTVYTAILVTYTINRISPSPIHIPILVWGLAFSILISTFFSIFLGRRIFSPIKRLSQAMKQVAGGDFNVELNTRTRIHEIEDIYHSFNRMTAELRATEILQTDFVSNVSHEIKTPISAIDGYTTLLQEEGLTGADRERYVEKILFNTHRLSTLVGNILLLSKVDNKTIPNQPVRYRLDEQIRQVIVAMEEKWSAKELELDVNLERVEYEGDESLLWHVWSNLIDNAIKYNSPGGLLRITLSRTDGVSVIRVDDSGPGIPADAQKHIFDKFYQADSSHRSEGNGLGLALVKRILDFSGGSITAENLPEGGCRFTVSLPDTQSMQSI